MNMLLLLMTSLLFSSCGDGNIGTDVPLGYTPPPPPPDVFEIEGNSVIAPMVDKESVLRNPCTGWVLYDDANMEVANAETYWAKQDQYAQYASIFYVRWRWSEMEPEEGKYAWEHNENYKRLIQGALDRGLKLAFRIYNDASSNVRSSTPLFVRDAGAEGTMLGEVGNLRWTPYEDDPVFQQKLSNFVRAFGREYDDPSKVDFIDGVNLGTWGECHHMIMKSEKNDVTKGVLLEWITNLYGSSFRRVPLVMPINSDFGNASEMNIAKARYGYNFRRDGLGSLWFYPDEKKVVEKLYGKSLLIGESCYWGGDQSDNLWFDDATYHFTTWRQIYQVTFKDATEYHFNTLDLRTPVETQRWLTKAPDIVQKFIEVGGYRLYPDAISYPEIMTAGETYSIGHRWVNLGTGFFPNTDQRWNFKYRIALALINGDEVKKVIIDSQTDPSQFLQDKPVTYTTKLNTEGIEPGEYALAIAIVDTSDDNQPGIKLATKNEQIKGWTKLAAVEVK